jgi:phosphoglycolate phosphatase
MTIRAVLFDKDGTLIDFHLTWMTPYSAAASELAAEARVPSLAAALMTAGGYDHASGSFVADSPLASGTNRTIARHWLPLLAEAGMRTEPDLLARRLDEIFARTLTPAPVPGVHGLLARLAARGLALGVATMDTEASAHDTLAELDLGEHLGFVCGCDSGHGEKPEPGMVHAFAAHAGLPPASIVMVGDSPRDLAMGRAAGAGLCVGVLTGASPREALAPLADHVLDTVLGLEALLEG